MKQKRNWLVVVLSLVALGCIVLSFFTDWILLIPAVVIFFINQRLLRKR